MKVNEKVIWFGLGTILPIVIGGIFLLKNQIDSDSEPAEKYSMVPDIEVEQPPAETPEPLIPEQAPPPVVEQTQKPTTTTIAAAEIPANESTANSPPAASDVTVPVSDNESAPPTEEEAKKSVAQVEAPAVPDENPPKVAEPESEPKPAEKPAPAPPTEYILKSGDNPWVIAQKFGISTEELLKENKDLNPKNLQIGQVLKLPKTARIVSSEETVKKVAVKEKPEEQEPANGEFEWYTIKSGENPWTISRKLKVDHQQVMELNKDLNFRDLKIGQKIKVPKKK